MAEGREAGVREECRKKGRESGFLTFIDDRRIESDFSLSVFLFVGYLVFIPFSYRANVDHRIDLHFPHSYFDIFPLLFLIIIHYKLL